MKIYGHRGASGYAPENTLEAFKLAIEMGVDGIETDIHLSKDNVAVLMHDERVDRTTNYKGYIKDMTYQELLKLNANNNNINYSHCSIPTLRQLLELVQDTSCILHLEIKTDRIIYEGIENIVLNLVKEYKLEDQVYYSSFNHNTMQIIKSLDSNAKIAYTYDGMLYKPWRYSIDNIYALHPRYTSITDKNYIVDCHNSSLKVNVWTVNNVENINAMISLGVDGIFTNYPDIAYRIYNGTE